MLVVRCGRVAQLAEQCPFKAWVDGSSPSALTISFNSLARVGSEDSRPVAFNFFPTPAVALNSLSKTGLFDGPEVGLEEIAIDHLQAHL
jgi:hypothetical protein